MAKRRQGPKTSSPSVKQKPKAAHQPEKPRRRRLLVLLGTLGSAGIAVLVGVLVSVLSNQAQRVVPPPSGSTTPQLQLDKISLTAANTALSGNTPVITPYRVDITVVNSGSGVAVINDARLVIEQFATLPICNAQGYLDASHSYNGTMPAHPKQGQVVDIPLSQKIAPNDADRFDLLLGLPRDKVGYDVYLYRVQLYLTYNTNNGPLDVGDLLINLPVLPAEGEYYWNSYYAADPSMMLATVYTPEVPTYEKCVINNTHALYSILSLPSLQPTSLAQIRPTLRFKI
jgi:hypothetical protein